MKQANIGTDEDPILEDVFSDVKVVCAKADLESVLAAVQAEAYNGEYTTEEGEEPEQQLTIADRVAALERAIPEPEEFASGAWYYRGDMVKFEGSVWICVAPAGVVCVWSPADYPAYWTQKG